MSRSTLRRPRIGLLPLYLKLYDETVPETRKAFAPFLKTIAEGFAARGVDVTQAEVSRVASEFAHAVLLFKSRDVDCIVTLHLAYSPSLESIDMLTASGLPLIILDTTMDADFGFNTPPDRIMYNHGIHGVMDMACMLRRHGKAFQIVAGHVPSSNVLDRAAAMARAAYAARRFRTTRALRIGPPFQGMGDFSVEPGVLHNAFGIEVSQIRPDDLAAEVNALSPQEIEAEASLDRQRFVCEATEEVHHRSLRVGLALRRKLDAGGYTAFSMNFLAFDQSDGPINTVPFLEASKAMARGVGYAGEGDVLTAALVGALAGGFERTTFTEIFCPDWAGNRLFLSHMGEINPAVAAEKPRLVEKPFPFTAARNPAVLACAPAPGPAVFVDLSPGPKDSFTLIVAPVELLGDTTQEKMKSVIRGWIRPSTGVTEFLEVYSRHGGTHHSALVLGPYTEAICAFADFAGIPCCRI